MANTDGLILTEEITLLTVRDGEQGEQGPSGQEYSILTSSEEVIKFVEETKENSSFTIYSPENLTFQIVKNREDFEENYVEVGTLTFEKYVENFYYIKTGEESYEISTVYKEDAVYYRKEIISENILLIDDINNFSFFLSSNNQQFQFVDWQLKKETYSEIASNMVNGDNYSNFYIKNKNGEYIKPVNYAEGITYYIQNLMPLFYEIVDNKFFVLKLKEYIENTKFTLMASLLEKEEPVLQINYYLPEGIKLSKFIQIRFGTNEDMAKFSVTAANINAAVGNQKLIFSAEGLEVQNGGFKISNEVFQEVEATEENYKSFYVKRDDGSFSLVGEEEVFNSEIIYYSKNKVIGLTADAYGNLILSGALNGATGTFSGTLEAASGSFSGEIEATSGTIGDLEIKNGSIIGRNDSFTISSEGIIANKITLGTGANISDYLVLGERVKLKNPTASDSDFLTVTEEGSNQAILKFTSEGLISIGKSGAIKIDGQTSSITGGNYWSITPEAAVFNNIVARGSIQASVLEYGKVQAVGGILLVRPSSIIKEVKEGNIVILENSYGFNKDDYCLVDGGDSGKIYYKITTINSEELVLELVYSELNITSFLLERGMPLINLGSDQSVGIAINASKNGSFVTPESITVNEFSIKDYKISPKIVLGKLPNNTNIYGDFAGSYGLYAENVILHGSLITKTAINIDSSNQTEVYSGISTSYKNENDAPNSKNRFPNSGGAILLWAGAKGAGKKDIENSPFFVDRKGNLYASRGVFEGSILTNATIEASELKTATITGNGSGPALIIKEATTGISFTSKDKIIFEVKDDKTTLNSKLFVSKESTFEDLVELKKGVKIPIEQSLSIIKKDGQFKKSILWTDENNITNIIFCDENTKILTLNSELISSNKNHFFEEKVSFGTSSQVKMEYKKTEGSYDLWVY